MEHSKTEHILLIGIGRNWISLDVKEFHINDAISDNFKQIQDIIIELKG